MLEVRPSCCRHALSLLQMEAPNSVPRIEVFAGEETSMFCANSNFLIEAQGAKGEFEENTPEGGVEYNLLNYQWEVLDASTPLGSNLVSLQDDCAFGSTPDLPCISSFDNAPSTTLSVYLTLSETDGCSAEFEWVDMVDVFPAPCIELTSNAEFCRNEDPELELCGPQSLAFVVKAIWKSLLPMAVVALNLCCHKPVLQQGQKLDLFLHQHLCHR